MPVLDVEGLQRYRQATYRLSRTRRLRTSRAAVEFVNERGFVFFWPVKGVELPSMWTAVAGDRPVADAHDDPGHVTWGWKDDALGRRVWYYGKVLCKRATMISMRTAPFFYALSDNMGDPEADYLLSYQEGRLGYAAMRVYEALLREGPLSTVDLRGAAGLRSSRQAEFAGALAQLQADFKILPVGVADAGAWHYSHVYEIVARHWPALAERARRISESAARRRLLRIYVTSVGAVPLTGVLRLFGWSRDATRGAVDALTRNRTLRKAARPGSSDEWIAIPALCLPERSKVTGRPSGGVM